MPFISLSMTVPSGCSGSGAPSGGLFFRYFQYALASTVVFGGCPVPGVKNTLGYSKILAVAAEDWPPSSLDVRATEDALILVMLT
jgi:hypothetical protein